MKQLLLCLVATLICAQALTQDLPFYADVMINADQAEHRLFAAEEFDEQFRIELEADGSFERTYAELPWISIQYPQDTSFRIISWQVDKGNGSYEYYGFFQNKELLIPMAGKRGKSLKIDNSSLEFDKWNGGLVYHILSSPQNDQLHFMLAFRQLDAYTKLKSLVPIQISSDVVKLGKKDLFEGEEKKKQSYLSMKYSADSQASFTLDEESNRIVFDNLVMVRGRMKGQGPTFVPDGSYKAYELLPNGNWSFIEKLYDQWNDGPLNPDFQATRKKRQFATKKN